VSLDAYPRLRIAAVGVAAAVAVGGGAAALAPRSPAPIRVSPHESLSDVLAAAPAGSAVFLEPGEHRGPITITRPLTLEGAPEATVSAPPGARAAVSVLGDRVRLEGFRVAGGETGIYVREADNVTLEHLTVTGAEMQGVDVADAHATITGVNVRDLLSPRAQGIEIRNSEHRGVIIVTDSKVHGGQEGIVSHVSRVRFLNNRVTGTTMHALSITEMSRGVAADNIVSGARGAGLYCGDMSLCDFRGNDVGIVAATDSTRSGAGWGLVVHYHSSAHSDANALRGRAGAVGVFGDSHLRDRSALRLGDGWAGLAPGLWVVPLALLMLAGAGRAGSRLIRPQEPAAPARFRWVLPVVVAGLAVQTFHMLEHGLQVYRVHFDGVPSRGGIVGPSVEAEWIHFTYNVLVFAALAAVGRARARGWSGSARVAADGLLAGAVLLQGYHVIEHGLKVVQHVSTGAKVNPGIAGRWVDLVWFHFGINLAVYIGFAAAMILLVPRVRIGRVLRRPPAAASAE